MASIRQIAKHVEKVRLADASRDRKMQQMHLVLTNRANEVFRSYLPEDYPNPIVENVVRGAAEDLANMIGVLPSLRSADASPLDESRRSRADKLSRIIGWNVFASKVPTRLPVVALHQIAYGYGIFRVEPNFKERRPHITVDSALGAHFSRDRFRRLETYFRVSRLRARELAALYPDLAGRILERHDWMGENGEQFLDVVRFFDDEAEVMYLPQRKDLVLEVVGNRIGRIPVTIADGEPMDGDVPSPSLWDALWIQAAKSELAVLNLEAANKAVQAPLAVPTDVETFELGPDAVIRTATPRDVGRVRLDIPNSAMLETSALTEELRRGSHYPDVRAGFSDASVVTGRGVTALQGGFDQRVRQYQGQLGDALADAVTISLEVDKAYFPHERRKVWASVNGSSYEVSFTPERDIYSTHVEAEFGLLAGLDANRSLVWALQALGAGLVSKQWAMTNLPINLDVVTESKAIDIEGLRLASLTAMQSLAQAIPQMAAQGQDVQQIIQQISSVVTDRAKGVAIEDAMAKAFTPPEPSPQEQMMAEQQMAAQQMAMAGGGGGMPAGPAGPAPMSGGPQLEAPYQPPTQQQLLTQLAGDGTPRTSARVVRMRNI